MNQLGSDPLHREKVTQRVVNLRASGFLPRQILKQLALEGIDDVALHEVRQILSQMAREVRQRTTQLVAVRFLRHDEILTNLIERLNKKLRAGYDDKVAKALTALLERQAKLLGLDMQRDRLESADAWLDERADTELVDLLKKRYGIDAPADILDPSRN